MTHAVVPLLVIILVPSGGKPVREHTDWTYDGPDSPSARVRAAQEAKSEVVKQLFAAQGVEFPPGQLLLRAFKQEKELEVWAASKTDGPLSLIGTWRICGASGKLGPKRRQGDNQVPEGFYTIDMFNSHSKYYLSMRFNYPNESDRILSGKHNPGSGITIHGKCVSFGCLAVSDERMQELWLITKATHDQGRTVHVHIFPSRNLQGLIEAQHSVELKAFWSNLKEGYDLFEKHHVLPVITVIKKGANAGAYKFTPRLYNSTQ